MVGGEGGGVWGYIGLQKAKRVLVISMIDHKKKKNKVFNLDLQKAATL